MSNSKHILNLMQLAKHCMRMAAISTRLGDKRDAVHMREMALEYCLEARQLKMIDAQSRSQ